MARSAFTSYFQGECPFAYSDLSQSAQRQQDWLKTQPPELSVYSTFFAQPCDIHPISDPDIHNALHDTVGLGEFEFAAQTGIKNIPQPHNVFILAGKIQKDTIFGYHQMNQIAQRMGLDGEIAQSNAAMFQKAIDRTPTGHYRALPLLHWAVSSGFFNIANDLIAQGTSPLARSSEGSLLLALFHGAGTSGAYQYNDPYQTNSFIQGREALFCKLKEQWPLIFSDPRALLDLPSRIDEKNPADAALLPWIEYTLAAQNTPHLGTPTLLPCDFTDQQISPSDKAADWSSALLGTPGHQHLPPPSTQASTLLLKTAKYHGARSLSGLAVFSTSSTSGYSPLHAFTNEHRWTCDALKLLALHLLHEKDPSFPVDVKALAAFEHVARDWHDMGSVFIEQCQLAQTAGVHRKASEPKSALKRFLQL